MPIYEFACDDCRVVWECMLPVEECTKPTDCPLCGEPRTKLISSGILCIGGGSGDFHTETYKDHERCPVVCKDVRTPQQQEALYDRIIRQDAEEARRVRRESRHVKRPYRFERVATVPRELWEAEKRRSKNANVWQEGGIDLLKKRNLYYGKD